ncbi:hypothetical protein [Modestobacter sp. VKM Ac-2984]|uniref:hypothetical protein n=1 Tax=Modestobacter sp. VKM Ac-2984 TaxID=3004138 RepID=UPI0022AA0250|nr:hypothetical protein [Modestobacter sp. VKM Ac-2984]MCZ2818308.1 hypothetical protein [Modestobacter sp. VKM Ac-2984]
MTRGRTDLAADAAHSQAFGQVMHDCLSAAGIDSTVLGEGLSVSPEDQAATDAAFAACQQQTGYPADSRLSDDAYRALYADYVAVHQCLVANDYNPTAPASADAFITSGGRAWLPYDGLSARVIQTSQSVCPLPTY